MIEAPVIPNSGWCLGCGRAFSTDERSLPPEDFGNPATGDLAYCLCGNCAWPALMDSNRRVHSLTLEEIRELEDDEVATFLIVANQVMDADSQSAPKILGLLRLLAFYHSKLVEG